MSTATEMRDLYLAAEAAVLKGQAFRMGERQLTRADLSQIVAARKEWEIRASREATQASGADRYAVGDFSGRCSSRSGALE